MICFIGFYFGIILKNLNYHPQRLVKYLVAYHTSVGTKLLLIMVSTFTIYAGFFLLLFTGSYSHHVIFFKSFIWGEKNKRPR